MSDKKSPQPNDQRSDVKNPNNPAHQGAGGGDGGVRLSTSQAE